MDAFVSISGKPHSIGSSERIQLSGMYNVRKGKIHLPVNRWTRRQAILCGTCLIVSSVKESQTGKMHVLPLIGGKVRDFILCIYLLNLCLFTQRRLHSIILILTPQKLVSVNGIIKVYKLFFIMIKVIFNNLQCFD